MPRSILREIKKEGDVRRSNVHRRGVECINPVTDVMSVAEGEEATRQHPCRPGGIGEHSGTEGR